QSRIKFEYDENRESLLDTIAAIDKELKKFKDQQIYVEADLPGLCRYWLNARSAFLAIIFPGISIFPAKPTSEHRFFFGAKGFSGCEPGVRIGGTVGVSGKWHPL
ncbi:MAG: hypothetical protein ACXVCF_21205, partial [Isosphaeraceae bacterium]